MNAVVLAGGGADAVSALHPGAVNKAFVPIGGVALVARTIAALRSTPHIGTITVVAPLGADGDAALAGADAYRIAGARMIESLHAGLAGLAPDTIVLVAASDLPILSRECIEEFIESVRARDLDVAYAIVSERDHAARFPRVPHTWARMREGRFCGGGIAALKPRVLPALRTVLDELGAARKSPLRLAALFGWDIVPRFALGRLGITAAEARATAILRAPAGAIRCSRAEIAVNVDRPADVALANELVA